MREREKEKERTRTGKRQRCIERKKELIEKETIKERERGRTQNDKRKQRHSKIKTIIQIRDKGNVTERKRG